VRRDRDLMIKRMMHAWLPLLVLVAVAFGGFVIHRMHGIFGSDNEITREGSGIATTLSRLTPSG
jgi:hypothetical protein